MAYTRISNGVCWYADENKKHGLFTVHCRQLVSLMNVKKRFISWEWFSFPAPLAENSSNYVYDHLDGLLGMLYVFEGTDL